MPRKKQGLRSYHHKSRNGCMQCKRRRVKCDVQQPSCGNCSRRNEICEYPPPAEDDSTVEPPVQWLLDNVTDSAVCPRPAYQDIPARSDGHVSPPFLPDFATDLTESSAPYCARTHELMRNMLVSSWFSGPETALWTEGVAKAAPKYPYLQHCVQAIAHMKYHNLNGMAWPSTNAYRHQLLASKLFRETTPSVDGENWLAVLAFAIIMLIFQFASQNNCDEQHFSILETLQALRNTLQIEEAARPYFRQTRYWQLIQARTLVCTSPDLRMRSAIHSLSFVVLNVFQDNDDPSAGLTSPASINRHAFLELEKWVLECQGQPRRWDQYQEWPGKVTPEYLDLVAMGDDVALLVLIHWTAVMSKSRKPFVHDWAVRAGLSAINWLMGAWPEQLAWPLAVFSQPVAMENAPVLAGHV